MRAWLERRAPWLAVLVLVAGIFAYAGSRLGAGGGSPAGPGPAAVAREFVATAVTRRDLVRAWAIAAPGLKQGMTLAEWKTGTISVTPTTADVSTARYTTVATSQPDAAAFEVTFRSPPGGAFLIGLERIGGRWLVASWAPRSPIGAQG